MSGLPLRNIRDLWDNCVDKWPLKTAVIYEGRSWSYEEADAVIRRLRGALAGQWGLKKGDRIAIALPNCVEFFFAHWASVHLGAIVVPVNVRLRPDEMRHVVGGTDSELVITDAALWPTVEEAIQPLDGVRHVFVVGEAPVGVQAYESLLAGELEIELPAISGEDLVLVMHTSGTTGVPKGAMITHENLLFNVKNCLVAHSWRHEDVHLLVAPMFHCTALYSMLPGSAYLGSTIVIAPRPDLRELVDLIETHRITTFIGVPMTFSMLTQMPGLDERDLGSLRSISYAGSPMAARTIKRLREKFPGVELRNFFGLTETLSVTHVLPDCDADERPDSVGKVLPDVGMMIANQDGEEAPTGEVGELCLRRENVAQGYWGRPELLEESCFDDWFRTGDLGFVDEQGYLYLRGRQKEMIIVGGENVYALEVETCLLALEGVKEVAVVGVPATGVREALGELIKAVVVAKEGATLTERDVKRHCVERLSTYKVPHLVEFREELPRNPAGKVMKRELV
ncbi:MAG: class I adenylate-forming enzyme family protein [Armatimonadota bacterium]